MDEPDIVKIFHGHKLPKIQMATSSAIDTGRIKKVKLQKNGPIK